MSRGERFWQTNKTQRKKKGWKKRKRKKIEWGDLFENNEKNRETRGENYRGRREKENHRCSSSPPLQQHHHWEDCIENRFNKQKDWEGSINQ